MLDRKKECRPFEDVEPLEYLARKNDSSLFAFSTHNKKRPHNMTLGRMFNHKLLGMCEMGVNVKTFKAIKDFDCEGHGIGSKPCMTFSGDVFDSVPEYVQLKSILIDMFKGQLSRCIFFFNIAIACFNSSCHRLQHDTKVLASHSTARHSTARHSTPKAPQFT